MTRHAQKQTLGVIIVAYGNEASLSELLRRVVAEKQPSDAVVLIDNHPQHGCAAIAAKTEGVDVIIRSDNVGFSAGCNTAVLALPHEVDLLLFLNPDAMPQPRAITTLRQGGQPDWAAWMGLVTMPGGVINTSGNLVHISGLVWCGDYNQPITLAGQPRTVESLSGACMMIRHTWWQRCGGFAERNFMYFEDSDLSLQLRLRGQQLGVVPAAQFEHDYSFRKGAQKWYYLERNRYFFMVRLWPTAVLISLAPFLVVAEVGLWVLALLQGRLLVRARAVGSVWRQLPGLLTERRALQRLRTTTSRQFLDGLTPAINTDQLGRLGHPKFVNWLLRHYFRLARFLLPG